MQRPLKYRNKPVEIDGFRFASKAEGRRYQELKLLQRAGEIEHLVLQPRFPLKVAGSLIATYVADFEYVDNRTRARVIEDVKGVATPVYRMKKALMRALHGLDVVEIAA